MWAQLQRVKVVPGKDAEILGIFDQLAEIEQEDSGLLRTIVLRSQVDSEDVFVLVLFESEEKARARDTDPRRAEPLAGIRANMGGVLNGPPEFFDCTVLLDR